jgi:hypothetical protein
MREVPIKVTNARLVLLTLVGLIVAAFVFQVFLRYDYRVVDKTLYRIDRLTLEADVVYPRTNVMCNPLDRLCPP